MDNTVTPDTRALQPFEPAYVCPHCHAFAQQEWTQCGIDLLNGGTEGEADLSLVSYAAGKCLSCSKHTLWSWGGIAGTIPLPRGTRRTTAHQLLIPPTSTAPTCHPETPEQVAKCYREAALVYPHSPRSAAALLRLGLQHLCVELGGKGDNINTDIAALVGQGLPQKIQKALDTLRVIGNEAVHPGVIDTDDAAIVKGLFGIMNSVVEFMISQPRRVEELYNSLPAKKREAIENRDSKPPHSEEV